MTKAIDVGFLEREREWSEQTFGPGSRTSGVITHIMKELYEIEQEPYDLEEWVDVIILAIDGAWRAGFTSEEIISAIEHKQWVNENRTWPDWRTMPTDVPIEHIRS